MSWTRRRSALALLALAGATPLLAAPHGRPGGADDDDDGGQSIPNLFISPCGEPFRAPAGAPYPVVDWFHGADKNGDGKLDHDEFIADAERFFKRLDLNGDGVLSRYEVLVYERRLVPEIGAGPVTIGRNGAARLWLAQFDPSGRDNAPISSSGSLPEEGTPKRQGLDESGQGASPYSFFEEPEPVMTADFNVNGLILKSNFLKVADMHFTTLDSDEKGFLTLKGLPETTVEKLLSKGRHGRRRS